MNRHNKKAIDRVRAFLDTPEAQSLALDSEEDRKRFLRRFEFFLELQELKVYNSMK